MQNITPRTRMLLDTAVVWDNHACMPLRGDASFLPELERYREVGASMVTVNIGFAEMSWVEHLRILSFTRQWLARRPDAYQLVSTADDVYRCKEDGKLGIVFDIEGMCPVQEDLSLVQTFYELGVRWMLIAYNYNNKAGGGCLDVDCGLTSVGRAIIDEMERVGMILCLSHTGHQTALEALDYARNPVIFSHSNPRGVTPHVRNVPDELMRACARKGGVVGLSGIGPFLGARDDLVDAFVRQLRYVIDLIGPEHVGVGLDYVFDRSEIDQCMSQNPTLMPADISGDMGMLGPEAITEIAEVLAKDNLSDSHVRGILGENWLRVARQVWK